MHPFRERILQPADLPREPVELPEYELTVWVRMMSALEKDAFDQWLASQQARNGDAATYPNASAELCVRCIVDEDGRPVFTAADAAALGRQPWEVVERLYRVAARLNGYARSAQEQAEKNSPGPAEGSPSAWPSPSDVPT
jgi:hypothetical protein